jgi:predicted nuclease of predicted toxin-antitoxin system
MKLSPAWVQALEQRGHTALHWSTVGDGTAPDATLLKWANDNGFVVFTNDLDFGAILAATGDKSPSVVQVRAQDVTPENLIELVTRALARLRSTVPLSSKAL